MDYISENNTARTILFSAQRIGLPGDRELGNVREWTASVGFEIPEFNGRCLHPDRSE